MIGKKYVDLIALGACLVGLSVLGSTKNPIERPMKGFGHVTVVVHADGSVTSTEVANITHLGLSTSTGAVTIDPVSHLPVPAGILTAANGDQLYWTADAAGIVTTFKGGTGRFVSATGRVTAVYSNTVVTPNPDGSLTIDQDLYAEGTITY